MNCIQIITNQFYTPTPDIRTGQALKGGIDSSLRELKLGSHPFRGWGSFIQNQSFTPALKGETDFVSLELRLTWHPFRGWGFLNLLNV